MPLSLEHFKMLSAKASSLELGTGGKPEISFHEVADLLARVDHVVSVYGRYVYARQRELFASLVRLLVDELKPDDLEEIPDWFVQVIELALRVTNSDYPLTNSQKAYALGIPWWNRKHENLYRSAQSLIDQWDYELRLAIKRWNESAHVG